MIERGKFRSLTLINWNGFFARTFELDELVTTLSGGNGAGKSTTMAAFVTALIPDLTLLHFRNTTEAGATSGSRDKGLYGKLRPGVCYAILEIINSHHQRVLCAVRLQQVAGRDRKIDIKPFVIQGVPESVQPVTLFIESVAEQQARVLPLEEVRARIDTDEQTLLKPFNSITDYHAYLFDLGVLPKRLRSASERSKYYKLIEASLYGGISSAITRSLRDYLLPENSGVRKAFQDMEAALRENRMTLEAIRTTQADRDHFKHLITEATHYVAADFMRQHNERRTQISGALIHRGQFFSQRQELAQQQLSRVKLAQDLQENALLEAELDADNQAAAEQLSLVQTAVRQQEKITRYQTEMVLLSEQLAEQNDDVIESAEVLAELQMQLQQAEEEVDEIKSQLANYQQALDVQQTRALQYQQAVHALEKAKIQCNLPQLTADNTREWCQRYEEQVHSITDAILQLEQKVSLSTAAVDQFERAYQLVNQLAGETVPRHKAWETALKLLRKFPSYQYEVEKRHDLQQTLLLLEQRHHEQRKAQRQLDALSQLIAQPVQATSLESLKQTLDGEFAALSVTSGAYNEQRMILTQQLTQHQQQLRDSQAKVPAWVAAQEILATLQSQSQKVLDHNQAVTEYMQAVLEQERELTFRRDDITSRKRAVDEQIVRLSQSSGSEDERLVSLAEQFGGVLLSEIYEDIDLDDAPYFSALYGPARHGIVISDLSGIREQLTMIDDLPDDLYFIEGNPQSFDDSVFDAEELGSAVLVKSNDRQWRYSRFSPTALFGRAARERQLSVLSSERETLSEEYAALSFGIQKQQRLHQQLSAFIGMHLSVAFEPNPEETIAQLTSTQMNIDRELSRLDKQYQTDNARVTHLTDAISAINRLMPHLHLLLDDDLDARIDDLNIELTQAAAAADYVEKYASVIDELEPLLAILQTDPKNNNELLADYTQRQAEQTALRQQLFLLTDVVQRLPYFAFADATEMLSERADLSGKLRERLVLIEQQRDTAREQLRQQQATYNEQHQGLVSLKSASEMKHEMCSELELEIQAMGLFIDAQSESRALQRRDECVATLSQYRQRCVQLEKALMLIENNIAQLDKEQHQSQRHYRQGRQQIVTAKLAWRRVMTMVRENGIESRLRRRELTYADVDALRSMSDKALGSLRLAVSDNDYLRDTLRLSEDPKHPEKKIQFYLDIYQHLRERIRQDIIRTDDPIEAIEQMEIELSRLTEELNLREHTLAISTKSMANIIKKTIQREQNRIRLLNQGLKAIAFGQVNSVRLSVDVRESHTTLLTMLVDDQEAHQDLFASNRFTFSEALAKLYQRLNPHLDFGQRSPQALGEELLDYRNYLELEVEVCRGTEGWLRAESGALSTGEAIGTGMAVLVMVVQSWEEESKRVRGKSISPCRLLFLDEAARLDAKSIATLFELCERLDMQLIIAAPENISPEKGTTYKLVRKTVGNHEYVHVVGLRGFVLPNNERVLATS